MLGDNKITRVEGRYPIWEILDAPGHPAPINRAVPEREPSIHIKGVFLPAHCGDVSGKHFCCNVAFDLEHANSTLAKPRPAMTAYQRVSPSSSPPEQKTNLVCMFCALSAKAVLTQTLLLRDFPRTGLVAPRCAIPCYSVIGAW